MQSLFAGKKCKNFAGKPDFLALFCKTPILLRFRLGYRSVSGLLSVMLWTTTVLTYVGDVVDHCSSVICR